MTLTYGSLCTGYDGIGLGLELAGLDLDPLWMAETEPAMVRVLKREHEAVPNVGNNRGGSAGREGQPVRPSLDSVHALLPTPIAGDARGTRNATAGRSPGSTANIGWTLSDVAHADVWGKYAPAVALWERITGIPAPEPTEPAAKGGRKLSAALPEWMMGLRPGLLTDELSRAEALKGAGNGVVPLAAAAAWRLLTES